jgi:hypothetical protein
MANDRRGNRCGRYAKLPLTVCSTHDPARKAGGIIAQQATDDLPTLLRRLTKDSDPAIRLRAITSLLDRQDAGCPVCKAGETRAARMQTFIAALTEVEKARASQLTSAWKDFCNEVYERDESLRPENWTAPVVSAPYQYIAPVPTDPAAPVVVPEDALILTRDKDGQAVYVKDDATWRTL